METQRLSAIIIKHGVDSWDTHGALPEVCLLPLVGKSFGFEEEDISSQTTLAMSHERGQFSNARARTRAMWVDQHDERRALRRKLYMTLNRPTLRWRRGDAGRVLVVA